MKFLFYNQLLIIMLCFTHHVTAQYQESDLLSWLEKNSREELSKRLDFFQKKYPNSPVPLYLQAYIEEDGERAVEIYQQIIQNYPQSQFADKALLKVAQYYYAIGSYISARQFLDNLNDQYAQSPLIPEAKYLAARCLIATGYYSSAETELKQIIKKHSDSPFKAQAKRDLAWLEKLSHQESVPPQLNPENRPPRSQSENAPSRYKYTIQIGAFREKDNALKLKEFYSEKGYDTAIESKYLNGNPLYLVWVGEFDTEEQAANFGKVFKSLHGVSFHVVKK